MSDRYADLDRPPLSERALRSALQRDGRLWREVRVLERTASTNEVVAVEAGSGAPAGLVVVAEEQTAGRGRLDRSWTSPARAGLTFSVLLRPEGVPTARWSWLAPLVGLAVQRALVRTCGVPAVLKWPNDVQVGDRKLAGVLVAATGSAVAAGVGLNVSTSRAELPHDGSTSLVLEEAECTDRDPVLRAVLRQLAHDYLAWQDVAGDPWECGLHPAYVAACATLGQEVRVELPDGGTLTGVASAVDGDGRLVVSTVDGERAVAAGDVVHVRSVPS